MKRMVPLALLATTTASAQAVPDAQSSGFDIGREAASLGKSIDAGIRACDRQVTERTPEARASQRGLESKGFHFSDDAPPYITRLSGGKFGPARYHRWFDPHAEIWIVAYTTMEACRVVVLNSLYAQASRPEVERLLTIDGFWKKDEASSVATPAGWSSVYRASTPADATVEPILKMQGIGAPDSTGSGIQIAALVALARK